MGLPTFEWVDVRSLLTSTSAASLSADSSVGGDHMKQRIPCARCGTIALRSGASGMESAGPPELLGAVGRPGLHPHRGAI
jgi:hypothetical protein